MRNPENPPAHRVAVEAEHLPGLRVRVNVPLDVLEVGLHDRHVVVQFLSLSRCIRLGCLFSTLTVVNQPILVATRRVREAQPIDQRLLHTVRDDEDQEGHAVRVVLAQAEPLGKLGAKAGPPRVVFDKLKSEPAERKLSSASTEALCTALCTITHAVRPTSESGTRFDTSVTSAYTLRMRLSRRGLGSRRGERDSKTRISAALTSGTCCVPSLNAAAPAPRMSIERSGAGYVCSRARSSGSLLSCNENTLCVWVREGCARLEAMDTP
eukprot:scaffold42929_cov69-Phaeocystis_antarctica.AAC.10